MIKYYLQIIKPGIIFGNLISVMGCFFLASKGKIDYYLLFFILVSIALVIASACVFNNYIDRNIDKKMKRTHSRVLVKGLISPKISLIYGLFLGTFGFILLYLIANSLAIWLSIIGFTIYVGIYSIYMKKRSIYSTLVGSLSGAMPPLIGYCSVSGKFDNCALILLIIFTIWQMPHFYSITILRLKDYKKARIPVLPVKNGILITKYHITFYIIIFMLMTLILPLNGYVGYKYLIIIFLSNVIWLSIALQGYKSTNNDEIWARNLFFFSIVIIILLNIMISCDFTVFP